MAIEEKYGRLKRLMDAGKEKGFLLYDEINEILPDESVGGPVLDELLADLDNAGVEILEEPKLEFDRKPEEAGMELIYTPYVPNKAEYLILTNRKILSDQMDFLVQHVSSQSRVLTLAAA